MTSLIFHGKGKNNTTDLNPFGVQITLDMVDSARGIARFSNDLGTFRHSNESNKVAHSTHSKKVGVARLH